MTVTRNEKLGLLGTFFIHIIVLLYLFYFGFTKNESTAEEGLTVNFGNIDEAAGIFEPAGEAIPSREITSVPVPEPVPKPELDKELISQDQEASISLADKKKKEAAAFKKREEEQKRIREERLQAEQKQKAATIRNQAASAFGTAAGKGKSQGSALSGTGNQGDPNGDPNSTNTVGGGSGYGHFSLNGRSLNGGLPRPSYSIQEEGVVVVQITVSPKGNVVASGIALQGTNTDNATLRNAAISAARQARFNSIDGSQNQSGTITYRFLLK